MMVLHHDSGENALLFYTKGRCCTMIVMKTYLLLLSAKGWDISPMEESCENKITRYTI